MKSIRMRPVQADHKSMHVIVYTDSMFCYVIEPTKSNDFTVHHKEYALTPALTASLMHNPTHISNALNSFITQYHMHDSHLYLVLADPLMQEQICIHHNNNASLQDLIQPNQQKNYYHTYVGPINERALFYVCSMAQTLLLQLQLMCAQLPCYLQAIQSCLSVQHELYMFTHHADSARAQIAQKINPQTLLIEDLFISPSVARLVKENNIKQNKNLVYALGSFIGAHT